MVRGVGAPRLPLDVLGSNPSHVMKSSWMGRFMQLVNLKLSQLARVSFIRRPYFPQTKSWHQFQYIVSGHKC
jgi:hypothetical protein